MKFKPNYMLTFNVMMTEFMVALLPMLIVLTLIENKKEPMLPLVLGYLFISVILFTLLNLLNIVTILFSNQMYIQQNICFITVINNFTIMK